MNQVDAINSLSNASALMVAVTLLGLIAILCCRKLLDE